MPVNVNAGASSKAVQYHVHSLPPTANTPTAMKVRVSSRTVMICDECDCNAIAGD